MPFLLRRRVAAVQGKAVKAWLRVTREKAHFRSQTRMFRDMVRGFNVRAVFTVRGLIAHLHIPLPC